VAATVSTYAFKLTANSIGLGIGASVSWRACWQRNFRRSAKYAILEPNLRHSNLAEHVYQSHRERHQEILRIEVKSGPTKAHLTMGMVVAL
jgi:hypothetical protein